MSEREQILNPFPGPQPYRAADHGRFFGRDALARKLTDQLLARHCTTLYGPSGSGKSSLMQAGVIPRLAKTHHFRVVRVDGWPPGEDPLPWLVRAIFAELDLGAPTAGQSALAGLGEALSLAERQGDQPILIYLDQLEQVLFPERSEAEAERLIAGVNRLVEAPVQGLQIVLSMREDYLGRFRDRARERRALLAHGFRLGPLTVGEMVHAVCMAASAAAVPQQWDPAQLTGLLIEVRTPGQAFSTEAEVQAAYAQIVCRALFQERAQAMRARDHGPATPVPRSLLAVRARSKIGARSEAETILQYYLEATLEELDTLSKDARRLLEDHLVAADGSRTLRTEKELLRILPQEKLAPILKALEGAAILHAAAHQGTRYFEIGHDWLAKRVHEQRALRLRDVERLRHEEEQAEQHRRREAELDAQHRRQREEAAARLEKVRAQRRVYAIIAAAAVVVAAVAGTLSVIAWNLRAQAKAESERAGVAEGNAKKAEDDAKKKAVEASDARLMAGFRELKNSGRLAWGTKLLADVKEPKSARGWIALASDALATNVLYATLRGHKGPLRAAVWSHDGKRVLSASADQTARVWNADGSGDSLELKGHTGSVTIAAWSPDDRRVLTASEDGTARIWSVEGKEAPTSIKASLKEDGSPAGTLRAAAWSPDGKRIVTASDKVARVWNADDGSMIRELTGHTKALTAASFLPDGERVLTASQDNTARVFRVDGKAPAVVFNGHTSAVLFAAPSPDGTRVVTASADKTARVWDVSKKTAPIVIKGHTGRVLYAAWSPDGARVATASADRTARVFRADGKGQPVAFSGHGGAVTFVAFHPDGRYIATAARDQTARLWPAEGGSPLLLAGHDAPVLSAAWSPDGAQVLTVAADEGGRSSDATIRIWRPGQLEALPRERPVFFHSAFIGARGDVVASAYDDEKARLWHADGSGEQRVFNLQSGWIADAALSPDGTKMVVASFDSKARIVRVDGTGDAVTLSGATAAVRAAAWSPDGTRVAIASDDWIARVYPADGKGAPLELKGHADALTSVAWSADGKRIVTASLDRTARVFSADGKGELRQLNGHRGGVYTAAFSPDGARIVTASEDGTAQVWDAESGAPLRQLAGGSAILRAIWSPDGKSIAVAPVSGGLRLWSVDSPGQWGTDGPGESIDLETAAPALAMAFVDSGKKILAVLEDNTTRTFTIDPALLGTGLNITNVDCLPPAMRATYLDELEGKPKQGYEECERAHSRTPFFSEVKGP